MEYYGLEVMDYLKEAVNPRPYRNRPVPKPVSQEDADLIEEFVSDLSGTQGIKPSTAKVTATYLCMFAREAPGFRTLKTSKVVSTISMFRGKFKQNTMMRLIPVTKRFLTWLVKEGHNSTLDLEKVKEIKAPGLDLENRKASEMLTADEIQKMIRVCKNSRDRALLALLYEGALRPIEIVKATWGDVKFDKHGAQFNTNEKTGKPRYIRLIWASEYLMQWKNQYPGEPRSSALIFLGVRRPHSPITHSGIKNLVYSSTKRAGIDKEVSPYLFRHSRITHMIADETPDSVVKMQAWGSLRSNMLATYAHLSNADIDRVLLTKAGVKAVEDLEPAGCRPVQCPHCGRVHPPTERYCGTCGTTLNKEAKLTQEGLIELFRGLAKDHPEELVEAIKRL